MNILIDDIVYSADSPTLILSGEEIGDIEISINDKFRFTQYKSSSELKIPLDVVLDSSIDKETWEYQLLRDRRNEYLSEEDEDGPVVENDVPVDTMVVFTPSYSKVNLSVSYKGSVVARKEIRYVSGPKTLVQSYRPQVSKVFAKGLDFISFSLYKRNVRILLEVFTESLERNTLTLQDQEVTGLVKATVDVSYSIISLYAKSKGITGRLIQYDIVILDLSENMSEISRRRFIVDYNINSTTFAYFNSWGCLDSYTCDKLPTFDAKSSSSLFTNRKRKETYKIDIDEYRKIETPVLSSEADWRYFMDFIQSDSKVIYIDGKLEYGVIVDDSDFKFNRSSPARMEFRFMPTTQVFYPTASEDKLPDKFDDSEVDAQLADILPDTPSHENMELVFASDYDIRLMVDEIDSTDD